MFSIITIASSTTKPVAMVSAISDRLSSEKPQNHITPNVPISDSGSATPAMNGRADGAQEDQHHQHDQADLQDQRELHVAHRGADRLGAVGDDGEADAGRDRALQARQLGADALHGLRYVGAGLALDVDHDRGLAFVPGADRRSPPRR